MKRIGRFLYWWAVVTGAALLLWHVVKACAVVADALVRVVGPGAALLLLATALVAAAFAWGDANYDQHEAEDTEWDGP